MFVFLVVSSLLVKLLKLVSLTNDQSSTNLFFLAPVSLDSSSPGKLRSSYCCLIFLEVICSVTANRKLMHVIACAAPVTGCPRSVTIPNPRSVTIPNLFIVI